ncbi:hypothetical protein GC173_02755 [bacterium]|nr:hypothetical protein [bacterium]
MIQRRLFTHAILACLLAGSVSCGGKKADLKEEEATPSSAIKGEETLDVSGVVAQFTEPTHFEQGIGLHAVANGSTLVISLRNRTGRTIGFLPRDFALITSPRREDLIVLTPMEAEIYSADSEVKDGGKAFLRADLRRSVDLRGKRLVYFNPVEGIKFFIEIE